MAITKVGSWFFGNDSLVNKIPKPVRRGLYRAEAMGVGPLSLAFGVGDVASGRSSVGGALANAVAGAASYYGIEKAMEKPTAMLTGQLNKLVAKAPKAGALRFLSKLPGWAGAAAKVGTALVGSGVVGSLAGNVADKYAPIGRMGSQRLPGNLTSQQLQDMRRAIRGAAGGVTMNDMYDFRSW